MRRGFEAPISPDNPMRRLRFQIVLSLAAIIGLAAVSNAAPVEPNRASDAVRSDPCSAPGAKTAAPSSASWRARISRRSALYVILHVQKACRFLAESRDKDSQSAPLTPQLVSILNDLHTAVLDPIYRSRPDLEGGVLPFLPSQKMPHATPRDIQRTTATRISDDLTRIQRQIYKLSTQDLHLLPDRSAAEKAMQPFNDAAAELSFAGMIAFHAYPQLFAKTFQAIPEQPRTEESDENFRKNAPPRGSVRLSDSALALIKSFMRQLRREEPKGDYVASIGWAIEQKSKGPGDTDWISHGPGWGLGAYARIQVPPDVIDKVRDVEIVFSSEEASSLKGKIVDVKGQKLFVHD